MIKPLIKLKNVSKYYKTPNGVSEGMRGISLEFYNNEFVAITGASGSGKTTLLNVISGLDSYEDGELYINGLETSHYSVKDFEKFRATNIGFVFQNYNIIESYTVYQNIVIALEAQNYPSKLIKKRTLELIEKVGLKSHTNHRTAKLSGGQKQRVVIARALAKDAPIILADEPTGNLDSQTSEEILKLLKEISNDKLVILVSHNLEEVKKYATRNIILEDGSVKSDIVLEKKSHTEALIIDEYNKNKLFKKSSLIAFRNMRQTPKRTIFQLVLSMIVVFAFIFFYSSLIKNSTNNLNFHDENIDKLYISKRDKTLFTDDDLTYLNNMMRREMSNTIFFENFIDVNLVSGLIIENKENSNEKFIRIDSATNYRDNQFANNKTNNKLPKSKYEILLGGYLLTHLSSNKVGDIITINNIDFTVVGFVNNYKFSSAELQISFHKDFLFNGGLINPEAKFLFQNEYEANIIEVKSYSREEIKLLKRDLDTNKYQIIDPYGNVEHQTNTITAFLLLFFWIILIIILQIIFFVLYQVQKNMMASRKIDFAVYRSIGISEQEVAITVILEQLVISLLASILVFITLNLLSHPFENIYIMIRHLKFYDYLIVTLILVLMTVRMAMRFNKKIFNLTVIDALKEDL